MNLSFQISRHFWLPEKLLEKQLKRLKFDTNGYIRHPVQSCTMRMSSGILLSACLSWVEPLSTHKLNITKTCLYNFDPIKPHFYIVKLGFTGVYIIFLISAQKIDCGYSLEPPQRGGSNEYTQSMFWAEIWKISVFLSEIFQFLEVKFSIYLNRRVFVMKT